MLVSIEDELQVDDDAELNDINYHELSSVLFLIDMCSKVKLQYNPERVSEKLGIQPRAGKLET